VEFGRVVWLDEVEGGIVSRYDILSGNPADADQLRPSLDRLLRSLVSHLTCWRLTARSIHPTARLMRWGEASSMWLSPNRGPARLVARLMSTCPGSVPGAIGEPVLSPVSVCSNVVSACAAAAIMVRMGCSAGSAGALSPMTCGPLPVRLPDMVEFIRRRATSPHYAYLFARFAPQSSTKLDIAHQAA
jgi:hypothetical protein